jgi:N-acylglucosamine 2-epimerase
MEASSPIPSPMTSDAALRVTLQGWRDRIRSELFESVVPFWERHSLDREHGGYLDYLDRDGAAFDTKKHAWLQGQELWLWSRLYNEVDARERWLAAANSGARFLTHFAAKTEGRVFSVVTRDGRPVAIDNDARSELTVARGLCEWAVATGDAAARERARRAVDSALKLAAEPERVAAVVLGGATPSSDLAIAVLAVDVLQTSRPLKFGDTDARLATWFERLGLHLRPELDLVLDHVGLDGGVLDGPEGRVVCAGRAIAAARMLFEHAQLTGDERGGQQALAALESALDFGWDSDDGGLYLYLDRDGYSPVQIEWSRKVAWVHGEALGATLAAYAATGAPRWLERYERVADFTLGHFPDTEHGEWFACLDRHNRVIQRFKSGPRKGCFAAGRSLLRCDALLAGLS